MFKINKLTYKHLTDLNIKKVEVKSLRRGRLAKKQLNTELFK